jgi:alcohol dehydrogenase class IV
VRFGRGVLATAADLVVAPYALLTTPRAVEAAPFLAERAEAVHHVGPGRVDELSETLLPRVGEEVIVALGGGRVIDTAKAIAAAAGPPARVVAIPTTLSGAEMTAIHRLPVRAPAGTPRARPRAVVNDPELSASQPEPELVASALNALGHCVEAPLATRANPVSTLAAHEGARLIARALADDDPDRDALALAGLLAGYAIDGAGYGLHHVLSQTLGRFAGAGHGPANAVMLPHTLAALGERFPAGLAALSRAIGEDPGALARRLAERAGAASLTAVGVGAGQLPELAARAAERAELRQTPPAATEGEIRAIYERALEVRS